ncbi:UNVERIFIED_CONTAM: hypothetical protein FKN15_044307 [Acipenser sinensis]
MGNAAGSMEVSSQGKEVKTPPPATVATPPQKQPAPPKLPMPAVGELEERFNVVLTGTERKLALVDIEEESVRSTGLTATEPFNCKKVLVKALASQGRQKETGGPRRMPGLQEQQQYTMQPPQNYSTGGPHSSGQLTGRPTGAQAVYRGRWCVNSMNLPPDKMQLLSQYDNEKKWELVCDQERFQVKNPPSAYIYKLKSYLDQGVLGRKFKTRAQESTQVLRELEISLRTNHIGWAQEFLNEENRGLDVLVDYLSFAQCSVTYDIESVDNGGLTPEKGKSLDRSVEDLSKSAGNSPTHSSSKSTRQLTVR